MIIPGSGKAEPHVPSHIVYRHAVTIYVQGSKIILRVGIASFRGAPIPSCSFDIILSHANASVVHGAQIVLRLGVTLLGP